MTSLTGMVTVPAMPVSDRCQWEKLSLRVCASAADAMVIITATNRPNDRNLFKASTP
jgi:hypothetical protein